MKFYIHEDGVSNMCHHSEPPTIDSGFTEVSESEFNDFSNLASSNFSNMVDAKRAQLLQTKQEALVALASATGLDASTLQSLVS